MPVLSVQSTSIAPRFWIEFSRLTITFLRDMAMAPRDRHTETIIGSISGVRPTATASAKKKASIQLCFVRPLMRNTSGTMTSMKRIISQVNRATPLSKLVCTCWPTIARAMPPRYVLNPVSTITPGGRAAFDAGAEKADVLQFQQPAWWPLVFSASNFSTGSDSPVRLDWMTNRSLHDTTAEVGRDHVAGRQAGPRRRAPSWPSGSLAWLAARARRWP